MIYYYFIIKYRICYSNLTNESSSQLPASVVISNVTLQ